MKSVRPFPCLPSPAFPPRASLETFQASWEERRAASRIPAETDSEGPGDMEVEEVEVPEAEGGEEEVVLVVSAKVSEASAAA